MLLYEPTVPKRICGGLSGERGSLEKSFGRTLVFYACLFSASSWLLLVVAFLVFLLVAAANACTPCSGGGHANAMISTLMPHVQSVGDL